jgi:TRAP-type mannitol/chloroaromatic compound transport system permease small subunit
MHALLRFARIVDRINRFVGRAMVWPLLVSVVISAGNAFSRKFFSLSSNAWIEIQWHLFAVAFLCCAGYVLLVDEHVRVDALSRRWSSRTRAKVDAVVLVLVALPMTALFGIFGWALFVRAWTTGEGSFNAGGLLVWPIYLCIPLGMALLGLQACSELVRRIAFLRGRVEKPTLTEADLPPFPPASSSHTVR